MTRIGPMALAREALAPYFATDGEEEDPRVAQAVEGALGRIAETIAVAVARVRQEAERALTERDVERAELAEPPIAPGGGWRPIETAPKGKIVLLFAVTDHADDGRVVNWKMATGSTPFAGPVEWTWDGYRLRFWDVEPTHWMPLQPAPIEAESAVLNKPPRERIEAALDIAVDALRWIAGRCGPLPWRRADKALADIAELRRVEP